VLPVLPVPLVEPEFVLPVVFVSVPEAPPIVLPDVPGCCVVPDEVPFMPLFEEPAVPVEPVVLPALPEEPAPD
jgi:hypothetical protein